MNRAPPTAVTWVDRLSPTARGIAIGFSALFLIFLAGAIFGFVTAMVEKGAPHKPLAWVALAGFVLAFAVLALMLVRLIGTWKSPGLSAFDKRYYRMWGLVVALCLPIGVGLTMLDGPPDDSMSSLFSNGAIDPSAALAFCAVALPLFIFASVLYHLTIDDHEERAYLWGSTVAFYFVAAALPTAWVLGRGGWIEPLGAGLAFAILFASFLIQSLVWLWFKFR